jgi:hypothetical protein
MSDFPINTSFLFFCTKINDFLCNNTYHNVYFQARNLHKTLVVSHRDIPELEELLAEEETYEFDEHSVVVKEISTAELAEENCWIGENKVRYSKILFISMRSLL